VNVRQLLHALDGSPGDLVVNVRFACSEERRLDGADVDGGKRPKKVVLIVDELEHEFTVSDRGFKHWEPIEVDRGAIVRVYESSAARDVPCLWLNVAAEAHLDEPPRPHAGIPAGVARGSISAHMTLDQAKLVHAGLGAAIRAQEQEDSDA